MLQLCGRFSVSARVTLYQLAPVATQEINTGEDIVYTMARVRQEDLRSAVVDLASHDWIAARTIRLGQPITQRVAKRRPAASTGDRVSIVAEFGALTVKAEGRMLAQAYIGDRVRVSNVATDTVVQGNSSRARTGAYRRSLMTHLKTFALFILCAIGSQTGNAAKPEPSGMPMPPPVSAPSPVPARVVPGSLWSEVGARSLVGMNGNARRVGDLITVYIDERTITELSARRNSTEQRDDRQARQLLWYR